MNTPNFYAQTRQEWRDWLQDNHQQSAGVWLVYNKKTSGLPHLDYGAQVEEALCFGWIDSKPAKVDNVRSSLYFAPRKPKSGWSKPNKERVEQLLKLDLIQPAGLAKIEEAKKDGSWSLLDTVEALEIPKDLAQELAKYTQAAGYFAAFPRSAKRGILEWILQAKRPETRQARIEETARLAQDNLRANQWRQQS
jgi:uncharacterized protein YdeI (YjbR/CyaY-like superfamily)